MDPRAFEDHALHADGAPCWPLGDLFRIRGRRAQSPLRSQPACGEHGIEGGTSRLIGPVRGDCAGQAQQVEGDEVGRPRVGDPAGTRAPAVQPVLQPLERQPPCAQTTSSLSSAVWSGSCIPPAVISAKAADGPVVRQDAGRGVRVREAPAADPMGTWGGGSRLQGPGIVSRAADMVTSYHQAGGCTLGQAFSRPSEANLRGRSVGSRRREKRSSDGLPHTPHTLQAGEDAVLGATQQLRLRGAPPVSPQPTHQHCRSRRLARRVADAGRGRKQAVYRHRPGSADLLPPSRSGAEPRPVGAGRGDAGQLVALAASTIRFAVTRG